MIWPFPIVALLLLGYAVWRGGWRWALVAATVYAPFALYLAAGPSFRVAGLLAWLSFVLAVVALRAGHKVWAALLGLPPLVLAVFVAIVIATFNQSHFV